MQFLRNLFGKKRAKKVEPLSNDIDSLEQSYRDTIGTMVDQKQALGDDAEQDVTDILTNINSKVNTGAPEADSSNIWDADGNALPSSAARDTAVSSSAAAAAAAAARSPGRSRRTKTRLIGFEQSDGDVVDLFNDVPKAAKTQSTKFPVGWLVVAEGEGRGESFALVAGMSQIGRGADQAVQLDFGDSAISRTNHAAIVYDPDTREFLLGHGGKSNIVRLNDKPLISNEALTTGDNIRLGETVLRFIALCNEDFTWVESETGEEDEDVAIA